MVLGPTQSFAKEDVKVRWGERYTSDALNKKFLGLPRGVYLGFVPSPSGLNLTLKTDQAITFSDLAGAFVISETITGGTSGATASVRVLSSGFLLVDNVVGTFQPTETITGGTSGATAIVGEVTAEAMSFARVVTNNPLVPGRSEDMVDVLTGDDVVLNFAGFPDGTYHVILTASYQVGFPTTAQILTRTTPPASGPTEVLICQVTKVGATLTVAAESPASRHEPFAFEGQRFGFMAGGSIEGFARALGVSAEVEAARQGVDGVVAPTFAAGSPQTTGLPKRLRDDLAGSSMAKRLGKAVVRVRGNNLVLSSGASQANISESFAARNRDFDPFKDVTTGPLPAGTPTGILANGTDSIELKLSGVAGAFLVGNLVTGGSSSATGVIRVVDGSNIELGDVTGTFFVGETVTAGAASGTIDVVDHREGAITSEVPPATGGDSIRNIVSVLRTSDGRRPVDANGNEIYGRLRFGPPGGSAPYQSGQITLTGTLSFTNGNTSVTGVGTDFLNEVVSGDIIEGPDGRFYAVLSVGGATNITLVDAYVGPTDSANGLLRRRFLVDFVILTGGTETTATLPTGTYEVYFPAWVLLDRPSYDAQGLFERVGGAEKLDPIRAKNSGGVQIGGRYAFIKEGSGISISDGGGGDVVISGTVSSGGQTNTVSGSNGIQNTGDNVNAVLQPVYGTSGGTVAEGNDARFNQLPPADFDSGAIAITDSDADADPTFIFSGFSAPPRLVQAFVASSGAGPWQMVGNSFEIESHGNGGVTIYDISSSGAKACPHIGHPAYRSGVGFHGAHVPAFHSGVIRLLAWK